MLAQSKYAAPEDPTLEVAVPHRRSVIGVGESETNLGGYDHVGSDREFIGATQSLGKSWPVKSWEQRSHLELPSRSIEPLISCTDFSNLEVIEERVPSETNTNSFALGKSDMPSEADAHYLSADQTECIQPHSQAPSVVCQDRTSRSTARVLGEPLKATGPRTPRGLALTAASSTGSPGNSPRSEPL